MLILARKNQETVYLDLPDGKRIRVVVVDIDRDKVRLGFDAPQSVKILRSELEPAA